MKNIIILFTLLISIPAFSQVIDVTPASGASLPSGTVNQTLRNSDGGTTYVANSALMSNGTKAGVGAIGTEKFSVSAGNIGLDNNYFLRVKNSSGTLFNLIGVNSSDNVQIAGPTGADIYFSPGLNTVIKQTGAMGIATGGSTFGTLGVAQINNIVSHMNASQGAVMIGNKSAGHYMCLDWKGSTSANPIGRISVEHVGTDNSIMRIGTSNAFASGITNSAITINKEGQVGIGLTTAQDASALLEMNSNTKGFLITRMTTTQRNAISSPATGLQVYNSSLNKLNIFNGSAWQAVVDSTTADARFSILGGNSGIVTIGSNDSTTIIESGGTAQITITDAGVISTPSGTIPSVLSNSATLDFIDTPPGECSNLTITVTGAADGDEVALGVPTGSMPANGTFFAYVSSANTVTVRYCNNQLSGNLNPASGTFKVKVIK